MIIDTNDFKEFFSKDNLKNIKEKAKTKAVYMKIKNCSECPFKGHSGSFTQGGAKQLCTKTYPNEILDAKNPTKFPKTIPTFCTFKKKQ